MIKVKDLAIELSIKLGDPRTDAGDGTLFYSEDRLRYLSRGYGKLVRTLSMAMRKYKPGFVLPLVPFFMKAAADEDYLPLGPHTFKDPFVAIEEVIMTIKPKSGKNEQKLASKLDAKNYNQVRFDLDETNKASADNIYYTVMNNKLYILPDKADSHYAAIDAMGVKDISVLKLDDEVPIDRTYVDMLITFAAIEAMNDLPNAQKVQLYRGELIDQVSVIANYTNLMERNEGDIGSG